MSDRSLVQAHSGSAISVPCSALVAAAKVSVVAREHWLVGDLGPHDLDPVVLENDPSAGVVGAHHQVRQRAVDGAAIRAKRDLGQLAQAPGHRCRLLIEVLVGCRVHRDGKHRGERAGDRAFLDDQRARLVRVRAAQVDQPGDRGTDQRVFTGNAVAKADVIHGRVGVVREREHVAVA